MSMRSLGHFFQAKQVQKENSHPQKNPVLDAKTVFFLFGRIVREYYGKRGGGVMHPSRYENRVLYIKVASPLWANELLIQEKNLCERLNQEIGEEAIMEIQIIHGLHADD